MYVTSTVAPNTDDAYNFPTGYHRQRQQKQQQFEARSLDTCLQPNGTLEQQIPFKHLVSVGSRGEKTSQTNPQTIKQESPASNVTQTRTRISSSSPKYKLE